MKDQIDQVSDTALMAAAFRAMETERPDPLFRDPFAAKLAGERGRNIVDGAPKRAFIGGWSVVMRTRIIDDLILGAIAGGVDTVLNLGAGLDARPYRLELPESLRWIEVDYPHVIDLKEARLAEHTPRCQLERRRVDLADDAARRGALAEIASGSQQILVLTEAVTPYLSEETVGALAEDLRAQPAIRAWIVDYFSPESYEYRRRSGMSKTMENAPFRFEPQDYFGFFSAHGWTPKEIKYFAVEGERVGRPPGFPLPIRVVTWLAGLFATPERRLEMKQYAGFVMFEPAGA